MSGGGPVAGVDEVGRGPLAGPVVAAAVILRRPVAGLADSKTLSAARRERLAAELRTAAWIGIGAAGTAEIERLDILRATLLAMRRAVGRLPVRPGAVLVDGDRAPALEVPADCPIRCIVGGDALVAEIAAASIVAKVLRDRLMARLDRRWPGYGLARNAGYGTVEHRAALARLGPCPHHRRTFAPVAAALAAGAGSGWTPGARRDRVSSPLNSRESEP